MKLANRTVNNALFNTFGWVASLVLSFIFLPYIVAKLGVDAYGILTLGNAVIKYVAEYSAKGDSDKMNEVIGATIVVLSSLGLVGGLVIYSLAGILVTHFLKIPHGLISAAYISFCIGAAGFFITMLLSAFSAIPNGLNRYDITSLITLIMGIITMVGTVYVLYLGYGVLEVVCLNFVITLFGVIAYPLVLRRIMPSIRLKPAINIPVLRKVLGYGIYSFFSRIAYLLNYQADRVVMGALLGISSVTYYVVPFTLVSRVTNVTVRIGSVIFPAISELQGNDRYDTINELYVISSRIILIISTAICLPLIVFGGRFLTLWMGPDFGNKADMVIVLLTLGLYINSCTNIPSFVADGLGRPKLTGIAGVTAAFINVGLLIPLTRYYGIVGASVAFLASNAVVAPVFIWYVSHEVLGISSGEYLRDAYLKPLAAGLLTVLPLAFIPQHEIYHLYLLMAVMALTSVIYLLIAFFMGAVPQQLVSTILSKTRKTKIKNADYVS
jgi:O-antigen/teichoic acid export membrane protein